MLAIVLQWIFGLWLALVLGIVAWRMLTGQVILTGLLRVEAKAPFGFDRIQLVFVTLFFAGGYLIMALATSHGGALPDIKTPILLVLTGSNGTYIAVKYAKCIGLKGRGG